MLIPAAICGLVVFIYGLVTLNDEDNYPVSDICNLNITLCPNCESDCDFEKLTTSCPLAKLTYVVDNSLTVLFAIFMSFWGKDVLALRIFGCGHLDCRHLNCRRFEC